MRPCHPVGGPDPITASSTPSNHWPQAQEVSRRSTSSEPRRNSEPSCRFATPTGSVPPNLRPCHPVGGPDPDQGAAGTRGLGDIVANRAAMQLGSLLSLRDTDWVGATQKPPARTACAGVFLRFAKKCSVVRRPRSLLRAWVAPIRSPRLRRPATTCRRHQRVLLNRGTSSRGATASPLVASRHRQGRCHPICGRATQWVALIPIRVPQAQEVLVTSSRIEPRCNSDPSCRCATPTVSVPPNLWPCHPKAPARTADAALHSDSDKRRQSRSPWGRVFSFVSRGACWGALAVSSWHRKCTRDVGCSHQLARGINPAANRAFVEHVGYRRARRALGFSSVYEKPVLYCAGRGCPR